MNVREGGMIYTNFLTPPVYLDCWEERTSGPRQKLAAR